MLSVKTDDVQNMLNTRENWESKKRRYFTLGLFRPLVAQFGTRYLKKINNPTVLPHIIHNLKFLKSSIKRAAYKVTGRSGIILPFDVRWETTCLAL